MFHTYLWENRTREVSGVMTIEFSDSVIKMLDCHLWLHKFDGLIRRADACCQELQKERNWCLVLRYSLFHLLFSSKIALLSIDLCAQQSILDQADQVRHTNNWVISITARLSMKVIHICNSSWQLTEEYNHLKLNFKFTVTQFTPTL